MWSEVKKILWSKSIVLRSWLKVLVQCWKCLYTSRRGVQRYIAAMKIAEFLCEACLWTKNLAHRLQTRYIVEFKKTVQTSWERNLMQAFIHVCATAEPELLLPEIYQPISFYVTSDPLASSCGIGRLGYARKGRAYQLSDLKREIFVNRRRDTAVHEHHRYTHTVVCSIAQLPGAGL